MFLRCCFFFNVVSPPETADFVGFFFFAWLFEESDAQPAYEVLRSRQEETEETHTAVCVNEVATSFTVLLPTVNNKLGHSDP